jgi:hypothetical protein
LISFFALFFVVKIEIYALCNGALALHNVLCDVVLKMCGSVLIEDERNGCKIFPDNQGHSIG